LRPSPRHRRPRVVGVRLEDDLLPLVPARHAVGAGAERVLLEAPAELARPALAHDRDEGQPVQDRDRRLRAQVDRVLVDHVDGGDVAHEAHELRARHGAQAVDAELHVGGADRGPVGEARLGVEVEPPRPVVGVDPAGRERGDEAQVAVEAHERLVDVDEDDGRDVVERRVRIEVDGVRAHHHAQGTGLGGRRGPRARRRGGHDGQRAYVEVTKHRGAGRLCPPGPMVKRAPVDSRQDDSRQSEET